MVASRMEPAAHLGQNQLLQSRRCDQGVDYSAWGDKEPPKSARQGYSNY